MRGGCLLISLLLSSNVFAFDIPMSPLEARCWDSSARERWTARLNEFRDVYFGNLRNHLDVVTPFRVEFGSRGVGIAPVGVNAPNSGHHHLMIDTTLPIDINQPIPFSDHYRHFGKGFTETVIDLPPGPHKLRLLFADSGHRPYYLYSDEITVNVVGKRGEFPEPIIDPANFYESCKAWLTHLRLKPPQKGDDKPYFTNLRSGETVSSPFIVKLSVQGQGLTPANHDHQGAAHLVVEAKSRQAMKDVVRRIPMKGGENEMVLNLPPGTHTLRAELASSSGASNVGETITLKVRGRTPNM